MYRVATGAICMQAFIPDPQHSRHNKYLPDQRRAAPFLGSFFHPDLGCPSASCMLCLVCVRPSDGLCVCSLVILVVCYVCVFRFQDL